GRVAEGAELVHAVVDDQLLAEGAGDRRATGQEAPADDVLEAELVHRAPDLGAQERSVRGPHHLRSVEGDGEGRKHPDVRIALAEPELVDPEGVELFLAIAHALLVIVEQAHERSLAETAAAEGIAAEERLAKRLVELLLEPAGDGNGEAPLSRRRALGGKPLV